MTETFSAPLVKYIWHTPNAENLIADMARVSSPENVGKDSTKLIKYLLKNKHFSPFEMVNLCIEINTTRDIGRQLLRHRSFSFQEFSQRYADVTKLEEAPLREARLQDTKNRQNSITVEDEALQDWWEHQQAVLSNNAILLYNEALGMGIAKEVARVVLPEGLTMSKMYMNGTLRSWIHFYELRSGNGTQKETQEIAKRVGETLMNYFPSIWGALHETK